MKKDRFILLNQEEFSAFSKLMIVTSLSKKFDSDNVEATLSKDLWYITIEDLRKATKILESGLRGSFQYPFMIEMTSNQYDDLYSIIEKVKKALKNYKVGDLFRYKISIQELKTIMVLGGMPEDHDIVFD